MPQEKQSERQDRLDRLEKIKAAGLEPYPAQCHRDTMILAVLDNFSELESSAKEITIAGRLRSYRDHGNISFANLEDQSGSLQLVLSKKEMGDEAYKNFVKLIDVSDFIEAVGVCFITQAGEKSLLVKKWQLLTKTLRNIPDAHFGLKNEDERFRKRYLDIILNPEVRDMIIKRDKFWNAVRSFLRTRGFMEVETPILESMPGGAEAKPFITHHNALDLDIYLRIAPELWLKRLIVAGFEKVFEIGRVFRNEGMDAEHAQDYTVMEFYWAYADYNDGMKFVEELYKYIAMETFGTLQFASKDFSIDLNQPWEIYSFTNIVKEKTGIDPLNTTLNEATAKLDELGVKYDANGLNLTRAIDNLWKYCRKQIGGPGFLIDVPVFMEPLAKRSAANPELVERFQVILAGSEMGKAFSELNDPIDQAGRFADQAKLREAGDEEAQMNDTDFVEALEYGMPPTCGFGFSERLFWFLMNKNARECQIFPLMKPRSEFPISNFQFPNKSQITISKDKSKDTEPEEEKMGLGITYDEAKKLVAENIRDIHTKYHSLETEAVMRALARRFGENEEEWGIIGLLHDIDWEITKHDPKHHCVKAIEILKQAGGSQFLINTIISHTYGSPECPVYIDKKRTNRLEHLLAAAETATGLIVATALVRPDKKLAEVELASVEKKYRNKNFAANCNRDIIAECEMADLSLSEFLQIALNAMQEISDEIGL